MEFVSYREAVRRHAGFDPLDADIGELQRAAQALGLAAAHAAKAGRDELLDLIVGAQVGPALGASTLTFLHRYPASQAALARLDPDDPRVALRFELYHRGVELANGYHELTSAAEQRMRFAADQQDAQIARPAHVRARCASAGGAGCGAAGLRRRRTRIRPRAHAGHERHQHR